MLRIVDTRILMIKSKLYKKKIDQNPNYKRIS